MRYETDPGEHLFWATSENRDFLTADLREGGIYVVMVNVEMGLAVARVGLIPLDDKQKSFAKVKKLVDKKGPKERDPADVDASASRKDYIQESLARYEEKWKEKRKIAHLSPDMAIDLNM